MRWAAVADSPAQHTLVSHFAAFGWELGRKGIPAGVWPDALSHVFTPSIGTRRTYGEDSSGLCGRSHKISRQTRDPPPVVSLVVRFCLALPE